MSKLHCAIKDNQLKINSFKTQIVKEPIFTVVYTLNLLNNITSKTCQKSAHYQYR